MNIGILTFHNSVNYGAVMQAYALVKVLNRLGYDAEIIDYQCEKIKSDLLKNRKTKNPLKYIFYIKKGLEFDMFNRRYIKLSEKHKIDKVNIYDYLSGYDIIIVGSDQIWNTKITDKDYLFFLENIDRYKISYAASCGDLIDFNEKELNYLSQFNNISVRENNLKRYFDYVGLKSVVTCDPTILGGKRIFDRFVGRRHIKEKYIFVFLIWKSESLLKIAEQFAKNMGLKIISNKNDFRFIINSKPEDFVNWIANAEFVFTNSFHGTIFSLLFHKKFLSSIIKPSGEINYRILDLLQNLKCHKNIINEERMIDAVPDINYDIVDRKMKSMRMDGILYLKNCIENYLYENNK